MFIVARVSVDVHVIGVVVLGVFGLSGPVLATVVIHVRFGEVLDDSNVFGATVVVHGPRDVDRSGSDLRVLPT